MPVSNGQVGRYDLRREAVHSDHIVEEAVTTGKIPDLAVTFPDKIDDPFWNYSTSQRLFTNETVTTTPTSFGLLPIEVPTWVDTVTVFALGTFQISNTSGGTINAQAAAEIEEDAQGASSASVANNETVHLSVHRVRSLVGVAGSTINCSLEVSVNSGTNTSNIGNMSVVVIGAR